jgi:3-hydroxyisobutyrate dehydrogenase
MVSHGMGGSVAMERLAPKSLEGDFKPGFLVEHLRKDLGLALAQAEDTEITLPGAETAYTLYDMLYQIGGARLGTQAISLLYQDEATCTAAGLDWSKLDVEDLAGEDEKDGHCCGGHGGDGCCGGHGHEGGHCCHHHGDRE